MEYFDFIDSLTSYPVDLEEMLFQGATGGLTGSPMTAPAVIT